MGEPTDEEILRVSEKLAAITPRMNWWQIQTAAKLAIVEVRAMDREKLKLSERALHRLTRQSWDNDSPTGT